MKTFIAYLFILAGVTTASGFIGYDLSDPEEDRTVCYWFDTGEEWVLVSDYTENGLCHYGNF